MLEKKPTAAIRIALMGHRNIVRVERVINGEDRVLEGKWFGVRANNVLHLTCLQQPRGGFLVSVGSR
jgi:hypothetical protein